MARGYANVYSGDGFEARFVGTGGAAERRDDEFRTRRQDYESERMSRDLREQEREDSLNEHARTTFSSAWDTIRRDRTGMDPLTVARDYTTHAAKLGVYMKSGQYDKAFEEYSVLASARDNGGDSLFAVSSTDPRRTGNRADADLQTGAQHLLQSSFDTFETVVRQTGETVTAYDLFHDGNAYKKFEMGNVLARNFGADLVKAVSSDDEFERRIANRISDSVVNNVDTEHRLQYRDLGDYVFSNGGMKVLRDELGDDGTERLIEDALSNGIKDGTFRDRMDFVRDVVWQQRQADPTKDTYRLVRDNLDAFNRKVKSMSAKYPVSDPASARRYVAKIMTMAAEESPGAIDFDDERVSERLDRWAGLAARAEQFGIPLLVDSHEGGLAVRKAVAESMTPQSLAGEPSETEALVRLERAFDLAGSVLSAGCIPSTSVKSPGDSAVTLGFTSGDTVLDGAMKLMVSDLLRDHIFPQMYRGAREDAAVRTLSHDAAARGRLAETWGDAISVSTGMAPVVGAYLASRIIEKAFRDSGVAPVSLRSELTAAAFAKDVPREVAAGLRRYVKARELVDNSVLDDALANYRNMLMDPLVGHGLGRKDVVDAYIADMKHRMVSVMEKGGDPNIVAEAASKTGYPFLWTGQWVLADGSVVSNHEFESKKRVTEDGREEAISTKGAIPEVGRSRTPVDLDRRSVELPLFGGMKKRAVDLPEGSWSGNETGYRGAMAYMKQLADMAIYLRKKRAEREAKASGTDGIRTD